MQSNFMTVRVLRAVVPAVLAKLGRLRSEYACQNVLEIFGAGGPAFTSTSTAEGVTTWHGSNGLFSPQCC
jgi:hypothetical protein